MANTTDPKHFMKTSGETNPVWIHQVPYDSTPKFPKLDGDLDTDVCIVGSGISGVSVAYELVTQGLNVVLIEGREILSDDGCTEIANKHGDKGAKAAAESHTWALNRIGEISKQLGIECENHSDDIKSVIMDGLKAKELGIATEYKEGFTLKGWQWQPDQSDAVIYAGQATFHPTKYFVGVLNFLKQQPNFACYTNTRCMDAKEKGVEILKDCLFYGSAEIYKYVRLTECDNKDDYMIVGGGDHKVGQGDIIAPFKELKDWTRSRFPQATTVDYKWSGQISEPVDFMAFIGKNQGMKHTYIITGDSGNGLTHGVLAGRLIADEITGEINLWASLYNLSRLSSIAKSLPSLVSHDLQINAQYKRFLQTDISNIENLAPGDGGVLNPTGKKPLAVYKDDGGQVHKFSALCSHMKGVVCWNSVEKSWGCHVHRSRFSKDGVQLIGPAKAGLEPANARGQMLQDEAVKA
ncbi:nucleotide-binding domain-containing protein [Didymella exigua CBS 183.55]|uniref:Nucleotide-binding domain-containing protein n=1 Tax=Didymella exigua CBS 183.55 TaxID=1150837 RepID=A0A6A5R4W2_9PLEO|nr:nucleotide-binding domain-containing protein [Didymella exigua CBS 183.55]KAF1923151.1 nucleotide-binding domain-containing protein [Didymella exigua CBS 183.55]